MEKIIFTRSEWERIGNVAGWSRKSQVNGDVGGDVGGDISGNSGISGDIGGDVGPEKSRRSLWDIFRFQTKMFTEEGSETQLDDFILKALRLGYGKDEIVGGLSEFYRQHPSSGEGIFDRLINRLGMTV